MKRISRRHRVLGGILLLAALIWAVDTFTSAGRPHEAQARPTAQSGSSAVPLVWQEVSELVAHLTRGGYTPVGSEMHRLRRDLFLPTPLIEEVFNAAELLEAPKSPEPVEEVEQEPDFQTRHRLVGVMIGSAPLAVIDDRLVPLNADLDGCRLIEVHRDYVVFLRPDTRDRIVLELEQRPETP